MFIVLTEENIWDYAEGIDFCVIFSNEVTHSYTKKEFEKLRGYPKNNRKYWIIKDGAKIYIPLNREIFINKGKIYYEVC